MQISDIIEFLIIGIITGAFCTFAPALFSYAISFIFGIIKKS